MWSTWSLCQLLPTGYYCEEDPYYEDEHYDEHSEMERPPKNPPAEEQPGTYQEVQSEPLPGATATEKGGGPIYHMPTPHRQ